MVGKSREGKCSGREKQGRVGKGNIVVGKSREVVGKSREGKCSGREVVGKSREAPDFQISRLAGSSCKEKACLVEKRLVLRRKSFSCEEKACLARN